MGAVPSTQSIRTAPFCIPGGGKTIALIPFSAEFFPSPHCPLFRQVYDVHRDPSVRYYLRYADPNAPPDVIPPMRESIEDLYEAYLSPSRHCYPTNAAFREAVVSDAAGEKNVRPIACAVAFLYNGNYPVLPEGCVRLDGTGFYVKVIGGVGDVLGIQQPPEICLPLPPAPAALLRASGPAAVAPPPGSAPKSMVKGASGGITTRSSSLLTPPSSCTTAQIQTFTVISPHGSKSISRSSSTCSTPRVSMQGSSILYPRTGIFYCDPKMELDVGMCEHIAAEDYPYIMRVTVEGSKEEGMRAPSSSTAAVGVTNTEAAPTTVKATAQSVGRESSSMVTGGIGHLHLQLFITKSAGDHNMSSVMLLAGYTYYHQCIDICRLPALPAALSVAFMSFKTNIPFLCFVREVRDRVTPYLEKMLGNASDGVTPMPLVGVGTQNDGSNSNLDTPNRTSSRSTSEPCSEVQTTVSTVPVCRRQGYFYFWMDHLCVRGYLPPRITSAFIEALAKHYVDLVSAKEFHRLEKNHQRQWSLVLKRLGVATNNNNNNSGSPAIPLPPPPPLPSSLPHPLSGLQTSLSPSGIAGASGVPPTTLPIKEKIPYEVRGYILDTTTRISTSMARNNDVFLVCKNGLVHVQEADVPMNEGGYAFTTTAPQNVVFGQKDLSVEEAARTLPQYLYSLEVVRGDILVFQKMEETSPIHKASVKVTNSSASSDNINNSNNINNNVNVSNNNGTNNHHRSNGLTTTIVDVANTVVVSGLPATGSFCSPLSRTSIDGEEPTSATTDEKESEDSDDVVPISSTAAPTASSNNPSTTSVTALSTNVPSTATLSSPSDDESSGDGLVSHPHSHHDPHSKARRRSLPTSRWYLRHDIFLENVLLSLLRDESRLAREATEDSPSWARRYREDGTVNKVHDGSFYLWQFYLGSDLCFYGTVPKFASPCQQKKSTSADSTGGGSTSTSTKRSSIPYPTTPRSSDGLFTDNSRGMSEVLDDLRSANLSTASTAASSSARSGRHNAVNSSAAKITPLSLPHHTASGGLERESALTPPPAIPSRSATSATHPPLPPSPAQRPPPAWNAETGLPPHAISFSFGVTPPSMPSTPCVSPTLAHSPPQQPCRSGSQVSATSGNAGAGTLAEVRVPGVLLSSSTTNGNQTSEGNTGAGAGAEDEKPFLQPLPQVLFMPQQQLSQQQQPQQQLSQQYPAQLPARSSPLSVPFFQGWFPADPSRLSQSPSAGPSGITAPPPSVVADNAHRGATDDSSLFTGASPGSVASSSLLNVSMTSMPSAQLPPSATQRSANNSLHHPVYHQTPPGPAQSLRMGVSAPSVDAPPAPLDFRRASAPLVLLPAAATVLPSPPSEPATQTTAPAAAEPSAAAQRPNNSTFLYSAAGAPIVQVSDYRATMSPKPELMGGGGTGLPGKPSSPRVYLRGTPSPDASAYTFGSGSTPPHPSSFGQTFNIMTSVQQREGQEQQQQQVPLSVFHAGAPTPILQQPQQSLQQPPNTGYLSTQAPYTMYAAPSTLFAGAPVSVEQTQNMPFSFQVTTPNNPPLGGPNAAERSLVFLQSAPPPPPQPQPQQQTYGGPTGMVNLPGGQIQYHSATTYQSMPSNMAANQLNAPGMWYNNNNNNSNNTGNTAMIAATNTTANNNNNNNVNSGSPGFKPMINGMSIMIPQNAQWVQGIPSPNPPHSSVVLPMTTTFNNNANHGASMGTPQQQQQQNIHWQ